MASHIRLPMAVMSRQIAGPSRLAARSSTSSARKASDQLFVREYRDAI